MLFDKENCRWNCLGTTEDVADQEQNSFCLIIDEFLKTAWRGTAKALWEAMTKAGVELDISSSAITKTLNIADILDSAYLLITEAIEKTGKEIDYQNFYWGEVYTHERYSEPLRRGEKVTIDYIIPVKQNG